MPGEILASAVILPDADGQLISPQRSQKRRHSSVSDDALKRPRTDQNPSKSVSRDVTPTRRVMSDSHPNRQNASGQMEERKRGQRLFGALLGTLSQSSSSTAQKRRSDIEKKQQAKLRLQAEEQDDKKKQRLDALMRVRRREQSIYDRQSMSIRHANLLSQAHFLLTDSDPKLHYKPWDITEKEQAKIREQVKRVEEEIHEEVSHYKTEESPRPEESLLKLEEEQMREAPNQTIFERETTLVNAIDKDHSEDLVGELTDNTDIVESETLDHVIDQPEYSKDTGDDGGEVVEGEEDTVIY